MDRSALRLLAGAALAAVAALAAGPARADHYYMAQLANEHKATYNNGANTSDQCFTFTATIAHAGTQKPAKQRETPGVSQTTFSSKQELAAPATVANSARGPATTNLAQEFVHLFSSLPHAQGLAGHTMLDFYVCNMPFDHTGKVATGGQVAAGLVKIGTGDHWDHFKDSILTELGGAAGRFLLHFCANHTATITACMVPVPAKATPTAGQHARTIQDLEDEFRHKYTPANFEKAPNAKDNSPEVAALRGLFTSLNADLSWDAGAVSLATLQQKCTEQKRSSEIGQACAKLYPEQPVQHEAKPQTQTTTATHKAERAAAFVSAGFAAGKLTLQVTVSGGAPPDEHQLVRFSEGLVLQLAPAKRELSDFDFAVTKVEGATITVVATIPPPELKEPEVKKIRLRFNDMKIHF